MMKNMQIQLEKNGFYVLEDFFHPDEIEEMKNSGEDLTNNLPPESERKIFSTVDSQQSKEKYFLDSGHNISFFFESEALDDDGKLKVHPRLSLNKGHLSRFKKRRDLETASKVGHALHWLNPTFKKYTFDERIKEIAFQLNFTEPAVCQSMYIYKNPRLGSEVIPHQDATYLYVDPPKLVGIWIALDDATLENGCLWMAPGSHKSGVHRRYTRNKNPELNELLTYDRPMPCYPASNFHAVPVRKGSCIVIDGQVVHYSKPNHSEKSRHAYTFHIIETKQISYSKDNWLQPPPGGFPLLYPN